METTIKKQPNGVLTLERNGQILICPFRNPIAIPVYESKTIQTMKQGPNGIQYESMPCASNCPHFEYDETPEIGGGPLVYLTCGNTCIIDIKPEEEAPKPTTTKSGLIIN